MDQENEQVELVLASSSPRRHSLLREAGIAFRAVTPPFAEPGRLAPELSPAQRAEALAYFKASAVRQTAGGRFVLGADTVVAVGDRVLGKPADECDARRMLGSLSGTRHAVVTGVALLGGDARLIASEATYVTMRRLSTEDVDGYLASGEWRGKAGAYAIQETADRYVEAVEGSFSNVVGLPVPLVRRMIDELRRNPSAHRTFFSRPGE